MPFEVRVDKNDTGEWVGTAAEYKASVKGDTEQEALAMIMDALAKHSKTVEEGTPRVGIGAEPKWDEHGVTQRHYAAGQSSSWCKLSASGIVGV
jgi:predicted RNase H-like HicB family nuclease